MLSLLSALSATALIHSTMASSTPLTTPDPAAPRPQDGVWALLPADCAAPASLDIATWDKCAVPVGFVDDEVAALERPGPGKKATGVQFYSIARTKFATAAPGQEGGPVVAEVVVPMIFSRSYYYLSLTPKAVNAASHRFTEARGWPVACPSKDDGGCTAKSLAAVQTQAMIEPTDPQRLWRLLRIQPAAAQPDTSAAPAPPPPVAEPPGLPTAPDPAPPPAQPKAEASAP